MKKLSLFCVFATLLFACENTKRYTQQSAEIETVKSIIGNYVNGEWEAYQSHYAEGAQIFFQCYRRQTCYNPADHCAAKNGSGTL